MPGRIIGAVIRCFVCVGACGILDHMRNALSSVLRVIRISMPVTRTNVASAPSPGCIAYVQRLTHPWDCTVLEL